MIVEPKDLGDEINDDNSLSDNQQIEEEIEHLQNKYALDEAFSNSQSDTKELNQEESKHGRIKK